MPSVERLPGKHQKGVGSFREDNDFADMTLACEDGQQVEAHKVILAASSLVAVVNFHHGESNVFQEGLDSFILAIAEELQLKGLIGKTNEKN